MFKVNWFNNFTKPKV